MPVAILVPSMRNNMQSNQTKRAALLKRAAFTATTALLALPGYAKSLDIVAPTQYGGSDTYSAAFQQSVLPNLTQFVNTKLSEYQRVDDSSYALDPTKLKLKNDADVRVYFVGEGASYHNTLGFTTDGSGNIDSSSAELIFRNASSSVTTYSPGTTVKRTGNEPLLPGDFVDLGEIDAGSQLDFFLIADGARGGKTVYSTQVSQNPDGINHVVSFAYAIPGSPYLIIGFEDLLGGGDRDFNDVIFAVDIGAGNIKDLVSTPEPAHLLTLGSFAGLAFWMRRRQSGSAR